jgi:hypothetical protein
MITFLKKDFINKSGLFSPAFGGGETRAALFWQCSKQTYYTLFLKKIKEFDKEIIDHTDDGTTLIKRWLLSTTTSSVPFDIYIQSKKCTITSGPLILCKSKLLNTSEEDIFNNNPINKEYECKAILIEDAKVRVHKKLTFKKGNTEFSIDVCDYASAGNEKLADDKYFSIYF